MCGIAGIVGRADRDIAIAMGDAMRHRGPDDAGIRVDERFPLALAHRRLAIIDVSAAGHQPMAYGEDRYWVVANAEIYNFRELRRELEARGHRFGSQTDTEVLAAAYAQWGEACVERLRGMFAFAIVDRGDGAAHGPVLLLARDRLGIKPLYYAIRDGVLVFASEIKALLASGIVPRRLDRESVRHYLALGSMPQPRTILEGVRALPPGHVMKVGPALDVDLRRYWDIAESAARAHPEAATLTADDAAQKLRALLEDATAYHLISDVPVGAFLSGGIDSTAVVGLMSRVAGRRIRTFSVGFDGAPGERGELGWARIAAQAFATDHTEVIVSGAGVAANFDRLVHAIDQPSVDGTNTYLVAAAAGASVKVALSGLGGDELFAGYPHFAQLAAAARWDRRFRFAGATVKRRTLERLPGRLVPARDLIALERPERYARLRNLAGEDDLAHIAGAALMAGAQPGALAARCAGWLRPDLDPVAETSYVELRGYLTDTLLRDVDATAMAHAVEVRPVLLDHRVAEFAFALPARLKLGTHANKPALVAALRDLLPDAIIRRRKAGFELPLAEWLGGPLRERAIAAFASRAARAIFWPEHLTRATAQLSPPGRPTLALWSQLMLVEWIAAHGVDL